jgi:RNA polymerase sigma-70 factor, ECF subfamily
MAEKASPVPLDVTQLLLAWSHGDRAALEKLIPLVYRELHRLAHRYMRQERPGHSLQPTALIHEAYLRLIHTPHVGWQDRAHFLAVCAQLMRRILVDYARSRGYQKRGGNLHLAPLEEAMAAAAEPTRDLVALDEALTALATLDPRKARVVELRFFGGLTVEETAQALKISSDTVLRDWSMAKVWLLRELAGGADES